MRIISKKALRAFWGREPDAKAELEATAADWVTPADVKAKYGRASISKGGRVVFDICGNRYRLVVQVNYDYRAVYIRFVGTHGEYDDTDAQTI